MSRNSLLRIQRYVVPHEGETGKGSHILLSLQVETVGVGVSAAGEVRRKGNLRGKGKARKVVE